MPTHAMSAPPEARFWDRIAERYAAKPIADEAVYRTKLDITRRYLTRDSDVVEFGCGTGGTAIAHAPFVHHVLATDISERMLEKGRSRAHAGNVANVEFRLGAIETLDLPAGSADAVLGLSLLHLVRDLDLAVERAADVLRPGGVFVTSTACIGESMRWFGPVARIGRALRLLPYLAVLDVPTVRAAMQRHGLVIEHDWRPGDGRTLFMVARKPTAAQGGLATAHGASA